MPDIHAGLAVENLASHAGGNVTFTLTRVTHGRGQFAYGLHASTNYYSFGTGIAPMGFVGKLGFRQYTCPLAAGRDAYCLPVDENMDVAEFAEAFGSAFDALREASSELERCGFFLEDREFPAKAWARGSGDGHTGFGRKPMQQSSDEHFEFVFSWLEQHGTGGWTTHYRANEQPLSDEMESVLSFLGLKTYEQCIEFDFEPCRWRHVRRETRGHDIFDANNNTVHGWFNAHAEHFSAGIEQLLTAQELVQPFGMGFLPPSQSRAQRPRPAPGSRRAPGNNRQTSDEDYDVAISFATTERTQAEHLAIQLRNRDVRVFYDRFFGAQLWGKNLPEYFDDIYRKRARYCVMFVSSEYRDRIWTTLERRSAIGRAIEQRDEYILPIVVEKVDLPGLPPTVAYVSADEYTTEQIAEMVVEKLRDP